MINLLKRFALALGVAAFAAVLTVPASAADAQIEQAQAEGLIGERIDGYLGVVDGDIDPALQRRVNEINNKRRALYDEIAEETGTTTAQVAKLTGEKLIANAGPGEYVMREDGRWTRR